LTADVMIGQSKTALALSRWEFNTILLFLFFGVIIATKGGADFGRYFDWEQYFVSFDLSALAHYPKSPRGLPLVQWQYGPGLLTAISAMPLVLFGFPTGLWAVS